MNGLYSGVTMKLRYLFPHRVVSNNELSLEAQVRLRWIDWYVGHRRNARATCRHFGISPDTFYRWFNRFNPKQLDTLEDRKETRRPKHLREMTTPQEVINRVIAVRKDDLEKSKYEIKEELGREGLKLGTSTIQKIINRHLGLDNTQHRKKVKSRVRRTIARLRAIKELKERYPGSLVQIDTKHLYVLGKRFYLFCAIDCKTRFGFVRAFKAGSSASGAEFLGQVVKFFPFKIEAIQTDNGSEYLLNFHQKTKELGLTHFFSEPSCPKQNGRVERFIQTVAYEYFNYQEDLLDEVMEINKQCENFNLKYNFFRFHRALGYKTPAEALENCQINAKSISKLVKG
jgi:transposase InsO family protein